MRFVHDADVAARIPSRYATAILRLVAYLRLLRVRNAEKNLSRVLLIDNHQTSWENWTVGMFMFGSTAFYLADLMSRRIFYPLAVLIAIPVASILLQVLVLAFGLAMTPFTGSIPDALRPILASFFVLAVHLAASAWMALHGGIPARACAYLTIAFYALNAAAWLLSLPLRGSMRRLEDRFIREGRPSAD